MFRDMRRKGQLLSREACEEVLRRGTSGVLALAGDDGYPYAVPLSYVYEGEKLWFHSAVSGHKLDAIRRSPKASFCVVDQDLVVPREYTTYFRSVIVFGTVRILEDGEKLAAVEKLALRYAPEDDSAGRKSAIDREWDRFCMLELSVEHMSGKAAIELMREEEPPTGPAGKN